MSNEFDARIECPNLTVAGLDINVYALAITSWLGSVTGVMPSAVSSAGDLEVTEQGTPDMSVQIAVGAAVVSGKLDGLGLVTTSPTFEAPDANDVIAIVQLKDGVVTLKYGTEAASPSAPSVDSGNIKLAEVLLTTAHTTVESADITDSRVFV